MIETILDERGFPKLPSKAAQRQKAYRERKKLQQTVTQAITNHNGHRVKSITKSNGASRNGHSVLGDGDLIASVPSLRGEIEVRRSFVMELIEAYPDVLVAQEIDRAKLWLEANPAKRKTNVRRFLTNWVSRQQERGGSR